MSQELHKIGGYIGFQKGKPPKTTFENQENGMLPYLSPEYLRGLDDPLYVEPNERLITIDDDELIVLWDGSNAGEIFLSKKGVLASTMTKLIVDHSAFGHRYFTFSMKYLEYLLKAKTAGSGIPHVDKGIVKNLEIAKPPLPEQRAIASVLSKVDDAIAATKNTIAKAEQLKKALMQNLLTGRLKPDGTRRTDDEFYIDEKFGKVPKGWEVKKLRNITSGIVMGQSPSSASYNSENIGLPYVQGNTDMGEKYPKIRVFTSDPKKISNKNDILISVRAPVGELFINNLERIAIGRGFGAIRFEDQILASYFFQFFKHDRKQFIRLEQGTTFTEIGQREVKNLLLPVPPQNDTESICEKLLEIDELIEKKKLKIQKLERLKKALMQNLLTGKKRLKADYIQGFANG